MSAGNEIVDKVQQDDTILRAVASIMTDAPMAWTKERQARLVWAVVALAYQKGIVDGGESMKAIFLSGPNT